MFQVRLGEYVGVLLAHVVVVPYLVVVQRLVGNAVHPFERTPVRACVHAPRTAEDQIQSLRRILSGGVQTARMVAHHLAADKVGTGRGRRPRIQIVVADNPCVVLVLLVVAVTVCIESRNVQRPLVVETVTDEQLVVDLQIVVGLVVVIRDVRTVGKGELPVGGFVLSAVVVTPSVTLHILFRHAVIRKVCLRLAAERDEFHHRAGVVVRTLEHV